MEMSTVKKQYRTSMPFHGVIVTGQMAFDSLEAAQKEQDRVNAVMRDNGFPEGFVVCITETVC